LGNGAECGTTQGHQQKRFSHVGQNSSVYCIDVADLGALRRECDLPGEERAEFDGHFVPEAM
jgi:hypothetical protein